MASGFIPAASDLSGDEWVKVQQEIEERRREKAKEGQQEGGKSLYEVLQANKAAKQEAFEESIKLKNQFRTLDDGEAEFLDSVRDNERAREAASKREIAEGLEAFRKQREAASSVAVEDIREEKRASEDDWRMKRKRKRDVAAEQLTGVKGRKIATKDNEQKSTENIEGTGKGSKRRSTPPPKDVKYVEQNKSLFESSGRRQSPSAAKQPSSSSAPSIALGLAAYSSDED